MPTFVFNDETIINSYGFRVLNKGGSFVRFDTNPVMLDSHINQTGFVLGNWKNRKQDGFKLLGDSNFDTANDKAKEVSGQVDRGFIKACSMGLAISFDEDSWQKALDGVWELLKWELMEVSICAVPSNSNSLALYNSNTGKLIPENEFKLNLSAISGGNRNPQFLNNNNLNFNQGITEEDFEKMSPDAQLNFKNNNYDAYTRLFGTESTSIYEKRNKLFANPAPYKVEDIKTLDDFEKLSGAQQMHFKTNHEAGYMALFGLGVGAFGSFKGIDPPTNTLTIKEYPAVRCLTDFRSLSYPEQHAFKIDYPDHYHRLMYPQ
jgi:HK97 family phage prohead protease